MQETFNPIYTITPTIAKNLMRIESAKQKAIFLPINAKILAHLRETAKLSTTHYSTMIEGNRLSLSQIKEVIKFNEHFPGRNRDENEIKGYYAALAQVEKYAAQKCPINEKVIQTLHALVINDGRNKAIPTPYRDGQNVIRDAETRNIVYMPPISKDIPILMLQLLEWIKKSVDLPCPITAAIAHYQFATIYPYYDGNGRTARLLSTLILHLGGYDMKGVYSLEEYYAKNLLGYYQAISIDPSHNYYFGRAISDITPWIEYFIDGMVFAFEKVINKMIESQNKKEENHYALIKTLDPKQRKALELFQKNQIIKSSQINELFGFKTKTFTILCKKWIEDGFLELADPSSRVRKYKLSKLYEILVDNT